MEPESGSFDSTDEQLSHRQTILCPNCSPDSEVKRGIFVVFSFTADDKDHTIPESVDSYLSALNGVENFKLIKDVGVRTATEGHSRYALIFDLDSGLTHYTFRDLLKVEGIIDSSNGDPERNNCRAKFYNYKVDDVLVGADEPEVVYDSSKA